VQVHLFSVSGHWGVLVLRIATALVPQGCQKHQQLPPVERPWAQAADRTILDCTFLGRLSHSPPGNGHAAPRGSPFAHQVAEVSTKTSPLGVDVSSGARPVLHACTKVGAELPPRRTRRRTSGLSACGRYDTMNGVFGTIRCHVVDHADRCVLLTRAPESASTVVKIARLRPLRGPRRREEHLPMDAVPLDREAG